MQYIANAFGIKRPATQNYMCVCVCVCVCVCTLLYQKLMVTAN